MVGRKGRGLHVFRVSFIIPLVYAESLQFKSTFDSISRETLWEILKASSINKCLLLLTYNPHANTQRFNL